MVIKRVFLDFDGVICDSAFEAFRLALFTGKYLDDPLSSEKDHLYPRFLNLRAKVGPAWNYYYLCRDLAAGYCLQDWFLSPEAKEFEELFLLNRNRLAKTNSKSWLKLHKLYRGAEDIINISAEQGECAMLTNKNKQAVEAVMSMNGLTKITVHSLYGLNLSKAEFFQRGCYSEFKFIDDHLPTIEDCSTRLRLTHKNLAHADWGYDNSSSKDFSCNLEQAMEWLYRW